MGLSRLIGDLDMTLLERLILKALRDLVNRCDKPHDSPDSEWYEDEFNHARDIVNWIDNP